MKMLYSLLFSVLVLNARAQDQPQTAEWQNTWTYTYIKAKANQKSPLKEFLIKNWFAMDSIAVQKGLFNDYQLLENNNAQDTTWDYIVAVEYYTRGTYADIQEDWQEIRKNHQKVLSNGLDFPQLGSIVRSEEFSKEAFKHTSCEGQKYDILNPYLGQWHEYFVEQEKETLYGNLSIRLLPGSCALSKNFSMLTSAFTYQTLGYFDQTKRLWVETYAFSNGGHSVYEWVQDGKDVLMVLKSPSSNLLKRNRWTPVENHLFKIITEQSTDGGQSWQQTSTTLMKRIGG